MLEQNVWYHKSKTVSGLQPSKIVSHYALHLERIILYINHTSKKAITLCPQFVVENKFNLFFIIEIKKENFSTEIYNIYSNHSERKKDQNLQI